MCGNVTSRVVKALGKLNRRQNDDDLVFIMDCTCFARQVLVM